MKALLLDEHRNHFIKTQIIEFEDLINPQTVDELNEAIDVALCERLQIPKTGLSKMSETALMNAGYDLWRFNEPMKKVICSPKLAKIASSLSNRKPLRLAYSLLFESNELESDELPLFNSFLSLEQISCFQGLAIGLLLKLKGGKSNGWVPQNIGGGVYLHPEQPVDFRVFLKQQSERFLLIVYTNEQSRYTLNPEDPFTHELKRLGYGFGDLLKEKYHPTVFKG